MFSADVVMVEVACFFDGVLNDFLGPWSLGQLPHGDHVGAGLHDLLHLQADFTKICVEVFEDIGGYARPFLDESQEDMLSADILVVEALRLLVGELHHLAGSVGESFIHCQSILRQPLLPAEPVLGNPVMGTLRKLEMANAVFHLWQLYCRPVNKSRRPRWRAADWETRGGFADWDIWVRSS